MKKKNALVVVSHGSKHRASQQEFKDFIKKIKELNSDLREKTEIKASLSTAEQLGQTKAKKSTALNPQTAVFKNEPGSQKRYYDKIKGACLEFAEPQLESVLKALLAEGCAEINILPLFVFAGYHLQEDLPARMEKLKENFVELEYKILDHPAAADDFAAYIFKKTLSNPF